MKIKFVTIGQETQTERKSRVQMTCRTSLGIFNLDFVPIEALIFLSIFLDLLA